MSGNLRLNGTTSGYSELTAPAVAGDQTFTFPAVGGVLATTTAGGPVAAYQQGGWEPRFGDKENVLGVTDFTAQPGSAPTWSRVGNRVTAEAFIKVTDMTDLSSLSEIYLPKCAPYPADTGYYSGFVSYASGLQGGLVNLSLNITGFSVATMPADTIIFRASTGLNSSFLAGSNMVVSTAFIFSISYLTGNTDWIPKNGATLT